MFQVFYPSMPLQRFDSNLTTNPGTSHCKCESASLSMVAVTQSGLSAITPSRKPFLTFSIDRILGLETDPGSSQQQKQSCGDDDFVVDECIDGVHVSSHDEGLEHLFQDNINNGFSTFNDDKDSVGYKWLQCTRYHPPKLQRSKKKDATKIRKLDRNPRVPFTQRQLTVLEEKFGNTHYLSSMDVADLSRGLSMTETRVKIWFQNRRARHRREMEAALRNHKPIVHKTFQPLSIPSVAWPVSSSLTSSSHFVKYRKQIALPL